MPLMPCPACGREVSAAAATCPQCGHPMSEPVITRGRAFDVDATKLAKALGSTSPAEATDPMGRSWGAITLNTLSVIIAVLTVGADLSTRTPAIGGYVLALLLATWARMAQAGAHHRAIMHSIHHR